MKKITALLMVILCVLVFTGCKQKVDNKAMELKLTLNTIDKEETRSGVYTGEVDKDGLPDGQGKFESRGPKGNKWTYEGTYIKGHFEGKGKFTQEECVDEGTYKSDMLNGKATRTFTDGRKVEGTWKNGKLNGEGKFTNKQGTVYEGSYKDGKLYGQGKITTKDGTVKYEGLFYKGFPMNINPDYSGTVYDILGDFIDNEKEANKKYTGTIVEATGEVRQISHPTEKNEKGETLDIKDKKLIIFQVRFNNGRMYVFRADYDDSDLMNSSEFQSVRNGDTITVKGYFYGSRYHSEGNTVFVVLPNPIIVTK